MPPWRPGQWTGEETLGRTRARLRRMNDIVAKKTCPTLAARPVAPARSGRWQVTTGTGAFGCVPHVSDVIASGVHTAILTDVRPVAAAAIKSIWPPSTVAGQSISRRRAGFMDALRA